MAAWESDCALWVSDSAGAGERELSAGSGAETQIFNSAGLSNLAAVAARRARGANFTALVEGRPFTLLLFSDHSNRRGIKLRDIFHIRSGKTSLARGVFDSLRQFRFLIRF